jgi:multicomponent K+:H+ antiporter subunit A
VLFLGGVGLLVTLSFVAFSALDLALTQISVDVVSTVLMLMALALLPQTTPRETASGQKWLHAAIAVVAGLGMAFLAWFVLTRDFASISHYFLAHSIPKGGGSNVVNVILVDFRGYDTFGEITVLGIAALGVMALMQGLRLNRAKWDAKGRPHTFTQPSLMLRVVAQVVLPLALLVTVYIFMRGHNMPGGGFIAGLITAVALVLQYMAYGQERAEWLLRAQHGERFVRWIAFGLLTAGLTGVGAFFFAKPFLTSAFGHPVVAILGELPLATAALFDFGVYATVVGATLLTIASLGMVSKEGKVTYAQ